MKQERKVLGILAIIFGALALLGSWMPIINNFSFILAILALIFGLIGFAVNRKRPKTLAIIGTVLAVVSIAIVLVTQAMYAKSLKELGKNVEETVSSVSSSIESSQKEEDAKFNWTKEQFDALTKGDYTDPSNGTKLEDIVKDHPKASSAEYTISTSRQGEFKKEMSISYSDYEAGDGKLKSVYLSFDTKEDDDTFYLTYKSGPDGED